MCREETGHAGCLGKWEWEACHLEDTDRGVTRAVLGPGGTRGAEELRRLGSEAGCPAKGACGASIAKMALLLTLPGSPQCAFTASLTKHGVSFPSPRPRAGFVTCFEETVVGGTVCQS